MSESSTPATPRGITGRVKGDSLTKKLSTPSSTLSMSKRCKGCGEIVIEKTPGFDQNGKRIIFPLMGKKDFENDMDSNDKDSAQFTQSKNPSSSELFHEECFKCCVCSWPLLLPTDELTQGIEQSQHCKDVNSQQVQFEFLDDDSNCDLVWRKPWHRCSNTRSMAMKIHFPGPTGVLPGFLGTENYRSGYCCPQCLKRCEYGIKKDLQAEGRLQSNNRAEMPYRLCDLSGRGCDEKGNPLVDFRGRRKSNKEQYCKNDYLIQICSKSDVRVLTSAIECQGKNCNNVMTGRQNNLAEYDDTRLKLEKRRICNPNDRSIAILVMKKQFKCQKCIDREVDEAKKDAGIATSGVDWNLEQHRNNLHVLSQQEADSSPGEMYNLSALGSSGGLGSGLLGIGSQSKGSFLQSNASVKDQLQSLIQSNKKSRSNATNQGNQGQSLLGLEDVTPMFTSQSVITKQVKGAVSMLQEISNDIDIQNLLNSESTGNASEMVLLKLIAKLSEIDRDWAVWLEKYNEERRMQGIDPDKDIDSNDSDMDSIDKAKRNINDRLFLQKAHAYAELRKQYKEIIMNALYHLQGLHYNEVIKMKKEDLLKAVQREIKRRKLLMKRYLPRVGDLVQLTKPKKTNETDILIPSGAVALVIDDFLPADMDDDELVKDTNFLSLLKDDPSFEGLQSGINDVKTGSRNVVDIQSFSWRDLASTVGQGGGSVDIGGINGINGKNKYLKNINKNNLGLDQVLGIEGVEEFDENGEFIKEATAGLRLSSVGEQQEYDEKTQNQSMQQLTSYPSPGKEGINSNRFQTRGGGTGGILSSGKPFSQSLDELERRAPGGALFYNEPMLFYPSSRSSEFNDTDSNYSTKDLVQNNDFIPPPATPQIQTKTETFTRASKFQQNVQQFLRKSKMLQQFNNNIGNNSQGNFLFMPPPFVPGDDDNDEFWGGRDSEDDRVRLSQMHERIASENLVNSGSLKLDQGSSQSTTRSSMALALPRSANGSSVGPVRAVTSTRMSSGMAMANPNDDDDNDGRQSGGFNGIESRSNDSSMLMNYNTIKYQNMTNNGTGSISRSVQNRRSRTSSAKESLNQSDDVEVNEVDVLLRAHSEMDRIGAVTEKTLTQMKNLKSQISPDHMDEVQELIRKSEGSIMENSQKIDRGSRGSQNSSIVHRASHAQAGKTSGHFRGSSRVSSAANNINGMSYNDLNNNFPDSPLWGDKNEFPNELKKHDGTSSLLSGSQQNEAMLSSQGRSNAKIESEIARLDRAIEKTKMDNFNTVLPTKIRVLIDLLDPTMLHLCGNKGGELHAHYQQGKSAWHDHGDEGDGQNADESRFGGGQCMEEDSNNLKMNGFVGMKTPNTQLQQQNQSSQTSSKLKHIDVLKKMRAYEAEIARGGRPPPMDTVFYYEESSRLRRDAEVAMRKAYSTDIIDPNHQIASRSELKNDRSNVTQTSRARVFLVDRMCLRKIGAWNAQLNEVEHAGPDQEMIKYRKEKEGKTDGTNGDSKKKFPPSTRAFSFLNENFSRFLYGENLTTVRQRMIRLYMRSLCLESIGGVIRSSMLKQLRPDVRTHVLGSHAHFGYGGLNGKEFFPEDEDNQDDPNKLNLQTFGKTAFNANAHPLLSEYLKKQRSKRQNRNVLSTYTGDSYANGNNGSQGGPGGPGSQNQQGVNGSHQSYPDRFFLTDRVEQIQKEELLRRLDRIESYLSWQKSQDLKEKQENEERKVRKRLLSDALMNTELKAIWSNDGFKSKKFFTVPDALPNDLRRAGDLKRAGSLPWDYQSQYQLKLNQNQANSNQNLNNNKTPSWNPNNKTLTSGPGSGPLNSLPDILPITQSGDQYYPNHINGNGINKTIDDIPIAQVPGSGGSVMRSSIPPLEDGGGVFTQRASAAQQYPGLMNENEDQEYGEDLDDIEENHNNTGAEDAFHDEYSEEFKMLENGGYSAPEVQVNNRNFNDNDSDDSLRLPDSDDDAGYDRGTWGNEALEIMKKSDEGLDFDDSDPYAEMMAYQRERDERRSTSGGR